MKYERLTIVMPNGEFRVAETKFNSEEAKQKAIKRLAELEDKIENGTLIERYYIQEDELPNGKVWYNVCELNENYGSIKKQFATRAEAEARLAELRGNA